MVDDPGTPRIFLFSSLDRSTSLDRPPSNLASMVRHHVNGAAFWSSLSRWGIQCAQTLLRPSISCRIVTTDPTDIPVILANCATVIRASSSTIARTTATLSSVVTSTGRPLRGASSNERLPRRNSANHSKTVVLEGAWSPKAACNRSMLSCCVKPL